MAIIQPISSQPVQQPSVATKMKNDIQSSMQESFEHVVSTFKVIWDGVWHNLQFTPQEVMDAFGTDAGQLFTIASAFQTAVNTVVPGTLPQTPPNQVTFNPDGTVIIGDPVTPTP